MANSAAALRRIRFVDRLAKPGWFLFTGVLLGLSFPPFPAYPLALVALVPLLARWSRLPSAGMLLRETYSGFLIFAVLSGYWVLFHADMLKALLLGVGLLVLPLVMALPVVGSCEVAKRFGIPAGLFALVTGWLGLEFLLTHGPVQLPWLLLGHTQADALLFNQFADVLGVGGLTLWVWAVNLTFFGLIQARALTPRFALMLGAVAILASPLGYRAWRVTAMPVSSESVRVAVVQPIMAASDWSEIASAERVNLLADLADAELNLLAQHTRRDRDRTQIVIWPETALPVFPDGRLQQTLYSRLSHWTSRRNVALLTGAVTRFDTAPALTVEPYLARQLAESRPYYNSALLFDGQQRPQQYDKIQMLPVADQVPMVGWEPGQRLGVSHAFGIGAHRTLFRASGARFSTLISYEVWFGDHAREMVLDGAEFLTVLSNTGWWNYSPAFRQFESITRLRAIESRRAVVIASVTGGSGVILPSGASLNPTRWMDRGVITVDVPRHSGLSTYTWIGDVVYRIGALAALLVGVFFGGAMLFFPSRKAVKGKHRRRGRTPGSTPPAA